MRADISPEAVTEALQDLRAHEWTSTDDLLEAISAATTIGKITDAWRSRAEAAEAREAKMREALRPFKEAAALCVADAPQWKEGSTVSVILTIRELRAVLKEIDSPPMSARDTDPTLCQCGMVGPCMWEKCKSPIRAKEVQP